MRSSARLTSFAPPNTVQPGGGVVRAVASSGRHGFSKQTQERIMLLVGEGVEGDAHCGTTVQHLYSKRRHPEAPNRCQVHLFAAEMLAELAGRGYLVASGELGENVLTAGLELLALPEGARLRLGAEAVVEITGLRTPCTKIDDFRPGLQAQLWGPGRTRRAGVMGIVLQGGAVRVGDSVTVQLPPGPHRPLGPV